MVQENKTTNQKKESTKELSMVKPDLEFKGFIKKELITGQQQVKIPESLIDNPEKDMLSDSRGAQKRRDISNEDD